VIWSHKACLDKWKTQNTPYIICYFLLKCLIVRWFCGLHILIKFHWPSLHVIESLRTILHVNNVLHFACVVVQTLQCIVSLQPLWLHLKYLHFRWPRVTLIQFEKLVWWNKCALVSRSRTNFTPNWRFLRCRAAVTVAAWHWSIGTMYCSVLFCLSICWH